MPNRPYSSRGWSATQRPYYDLDFTDAFAAQMLALARQKAMAGTEAEERRRAAEERKTAATLAHQRGQEDIALREVLARQGEEAGRKARFEEAAALRKELLNRENQKSDSEARAHLRNIKASGNADEQNKAAKIEQEWNKSSPDERKLSAEALDKLMTARFVAESTRAPILSETDLPGGGTGKTLIDPSTGMETDIQRWEETGPITIPAILPFQIPGRKKVPARNPAKEEVPETVNLMGPDGKPHVYERHPGGLIDLGIAAAAFQKPQVATELDPAGTALELWQSHHKENNGKGPMIDDGGYFGRATYLFDLPEEQQISYIEKEVRFLEMLRKRSAGAESVEAAAAAPEAGQAKGPAKSLKDMTTEELLELRKRKQAGQ